MKEYGFYDCRTDYSINVQVSNEETYATVFHELTHMLITLQSGYGSFLQLFKMIKSINPEYEYIFDFFFSHMIKMQEACSTFSELIFLSTRYDYDVVSDKVNNIKSFNTKYYKYVSRLLFILKYMNFKNNNFNDFKIPIEHIYNIIKNIAIKSCDIDLTEIDHNFFMEKKILEKISNIDEKTKKYFPNKRFKIAINELKNQLKLYSGTLYSEDKMELILQKVYSVAFESEYIREYYNTNYYRNRLKKIIDNSKAFILDLYKYSDDYQLISDRISDISINEISIERLPAYSIPYSENKIYEFKSLFYTVQELIDNYASIYFIVGDGQTMKDILKKPYNNDDNISKEIQSKIKKSQLTSGYYTNIQNLKVNPAYLLVFAYDYVSKYINSAAIIKKDILRLNSNVPMVVNYKYYPIFRKYSTALKQDIFIYCDRKYETAVPVINEISNNNILKCKLIPYTFKDKEVSMSILIIKIKEHHYFLLPVVRCVEYLIASDIIQGRINISQSLELEQRFIDIVDIIINNLFYF